MHGQTAAHHCPIPLKATDASLRLLTTFLSSDLSVRPEDSPTLRHAFRLRMISLQERGGILGLGEHLEQIADLDDTLVVERG